MSLNSRTCLDFYDQVYLLHFTLEAKCEKKTFCLFIYSGYKYFVQTYKGKERPLSYTPYPHHGYQTTTFENSNLEQWIQLAIQFWREQGVPHHQIAFFSSNKQTIAKRGKPPQKINLTVRMGGHFLDSKSLDNCFSFGLELIINKHGTQCNVIKSDV